MVDDCSLKLVGQLAFKHFYGSCANVDDRLVYLCFNADNSADYPHEFEKCRYSTSPLGEFLEINDSNNAHRYSRIATDNCKFLIFDNDYKSISYLDEILAVGSYAPANKKAEVLTINGNVWSEIQDYPNVSE